MFGGTNGRAATYGQGCGTGTISSSSANGTYVAGSTLSITLGNAPANTFALLVPSVDMKEGLQQGGQRREKAGRDRRIQP